MEQQTTRATTIKTYNNNGCGISNILELIVDGNVRIHLIVRVFLSLSLSVHHPLIVLPCIHFEFYD